MRKFLPALMFIVVGLSTAAVVVGSPEASAMVPFCAT